MKREDRLAATFILKTPLHCLYIAGSIDRRPVKVHFDRQTIAPREGNRFIYWRRYWVPSHDVARRLIVSFTSASWREQNKSGNNWFWMDVDDAEARLKRIAAESSVTLTPNDVVVKRAALVIARYDAKLAEMNRAGDLKALNRAYKAYRTAHAAGSPKPTHYDEWRDKQLEAVLDGLVSDVFGQSQQISDASAKNTKSIDKSIDIAAGST